MIKLVVLLLVITCVWAEQVKQDGLIIGISKQDITGPVGHVTMMGYADIFQRASGLLNRLYARGYVMEQEGTGDLVGIVHCDIHSIPLGVHNAVVENVSKELPGVFNYDNVVIHGQHTHSGPGGLHSFYLYYLSVLGYTELHFKLVVNGISQALIQAYKDRKPRDMYVSHVETPDCSANRSPEAYEYNPKEEREEYGSNRNTLMTVFKVTERGEPETLVSVLSFFAVHTVSLAGSNTMVSSDNKGYAQYLLETRYGSENESFTASFFQTEAGDISPNTINKGDGTFTGVHGTDFVRNAEYVGRCQADAAFKTLDSEKWQPITGNIFSRKRFFDFSNYKLESGEHTCPAVSGINMIAGTEDGRGLPFIYEGQQLRTPGYGLVKALGTYVLVPAKITQDVLDCHFPKEPVFATGLTDPPSTPQVLPMQIMQVGSVVFATLPFEVTTMSGRRIRKSVMQAMHKAGHSEVDEVIVLAISNAYAGYLVTKEEYMAQHYEGACTHFGKHQLEAVQEMYSRIVLDPNGIPEVDIHESEGLGVMNAVGNQLLDKPLLPPWADLGQTFSDVPQTEYKRGQVATAKFWCGRPMNSQVLVGSFCDVQHRKPGSDSSWTTLLRDDDWNVRFYYRSRFLIFGVCTCQWHIPHETYEEGGLAIPHEGEFRLKMRGMSEKGQLHQTYLGTSSSFKLSGEIDDTTINSSLEYMYGIPDELLSALAIVGLFMAFFYFRSDNGKNKPDMPKTKKQL